MLRPCLFRLQVFADLVARVSAWVTAVLVFFRGLLMILLGRSRGIRVGIVSVCGPGAIGVCV